MLANDKRGVSLGEILHSTYALSLKSLLGSGPRLYSEQRKHGLEAASLQWEIYTANISTGSFLKYTSSLKLQVILQ